MSPSGRGEFSSIHYQGFIIEPFLIKLFSFGRRCHVAGVIGDALPAPGGRSRGGGPSKIFIVGRNGAGCGIGIFFSRDDNLATRSELGHVVRTRTRERSTWVV